MEYLTLGLNIALILFVVMGIVFGFIRGLRKTASRGIFLIITVIILLFVTVPITNALLKIKINVDMTIMEDSLVGTYSISECVDFWVKSAFGKDFVAQNPELTDVIIALPTVLINSIVYLLLFIVCKYLLLPLNYLFYRITFAPKKKENLGFSSFDNDVDFDKVDKEILANTNETEPLQKEENNESPKPLTTEPLHAIKEASEEQEIRANVEDIQNVENVSEDQFGKDGLFIKKEIETPVVHSVVSEDFDKPSKKDLKRAKKEEKKKARLKYKKHRLWGALVGAFVGMFVMTNVCMPIYGIMNIAKDANDVKISNLTEEETSLSGLTNGVSDQVISAYDSSVFYPFSKYLGLEGISLAEFDLITSTTVNNKKIKLRGDVSSLIATVAKADDLVGKYKSYTPNGQMSDLSQIQLTTLLSDSKDLLDYAKKVNLVDCVADYIIPIACNMIIESNTSISDNEVVNALAINALESLAKANNINVFDETYNILDLATYLNDQGLLIKIIKNDLADPIAIVKTLDSNFGSEFTTKLFNLQTVKITVPYVLNIALSILEQSINYGYVENDYSQSIEDIKNSISNFMQEGINVVKSIDTSSNIYLTTQSLEPLGKLLQTVKVSGIVNNDTYHNLINYAITQLQDLLKGLLPEELEDYLLNEFVTNLSKVDRWDEEMNKISSAIIKLRDKENGILGEIVDGEDLRKGTAIRVEMKDGVFANIGEALDILEGTVLFGAVSNKQVGDDKYVVSGTISLFASLLDYVDSNFDSNASSSIQKVSDVISDMQDNLIKSRHTYSAENHFWQYEMENVSTLIIEVWDMIKTGNFDITEECGKGMDKAKNTTLFGNDTTLKFMSVALDIVKDGVLGEDYQYNNGSDTSRPQVLKDKIYELFVEVQNNLGKEATKNKCRKDSQFWQKEFVYYKSLKNIAENSNFASIEDAKVLAEDLDNIMDSYTIPSEQIFNIVSFAIKDIKNDSATSELDIAINNVIDKIASRINYENLCSSGEMDSNGFKDFWQIEFDHLSNLMSIEFQDKEGYQVKNNLKNIGVELDKVVLGYSIADNKDTPNIDESKTIRKSYLIEADDIREILASAIPQVRDSIKKSFDTSIQGYIVTALNSIKDNIADTANITNISFQKELTHMQTLANLSIDSSLLKYPTSDLLNDEAKKLEIQVKLEENRIKLSALGKSLDSIAFHYDKVNNTYKYTDKINASTSTNSKFITRQIINDLIGGIFNIAKVTDTPTEEELAFNDLVQTIQNNIATTAQYDKLMSWQRELGFVNNLIKMNDGAEYDINNIASNIGANLDAIAFNVNSENIFDDMLYNGENVCTYIPEFTSNSAIIGDIVYSGNSLFITRSALSTLLATYLDNVKYDATAGETIDEQKALVNDIIDNCTQKVALVSENLNNSKYYNNYATCLQDMTDIKNEIDSVSSSVDGVGKDLTETLATQIDNMLQEYQLKPIMGVLLTRRMANLIVHKIGSPSGSVDLPVVSDAITYYNGLQIHYQTLNDANNNETSEYYVSSDVSISADKYPNPFKTLFNKVNAIANI